MRERLNQIAICVETGMYQRILESAIIQLGLSPFTITVDEAGASHGQYELILADPAAGTVIKDRLAEIARKGDPYRPAVIAIVPADGFDKRPPADGFDGVLPLPQAPATLAASLSIALYSHRSFERRYEEAMDELELNRGIFHSVTSGVSVADARQDDLPLTYVNPAFEAISGYSLEEVIGQNCRFLQRDRGNQPALTVVREAIRDRKRATAVLRNYRKDGSPFWNELSLSPIYDHKGELAYFVGIQTDVTARVEFELALRESEKLAAVGRLSSSIAHEINNPLESVTNLVYLARRTENMQDLHGYLDQADQELRRVKLITEQSLRFNRQSAKPTAVHVSDLIASVLDILQSRIEAAGVSVERRNQADVSVVCMESEIRQVLNNLVNNATDAMRRSGGRLVVRSHRAISPRTGMSGAAIVVADTGVGIAPEQMSEIFKPFYTTKGDMGSGLGLWICTEIIGRHHGVFQVRSSTVPGRTGTVFRLFLPFQAMEG